MDVGKPSGYALYPYRLELKIAERGVQAKWRRIVEHRIKYLELQERCETLLEDVSREFGYAEKHIKDVDNLEKSVNFWLAGWRMTAFENAR